jgi:hypothetical protein
MTISLFIGVIIVPMMVGVIVFSSPRILLRKSSVREPGARRGREILLPEPQRGAASPG